MNVAFHSLKMSLKVITEQCLPMGKLAAVRRIQ